MAQTIGLALGSGGARGWAHIGVLRALEEAEIPIDYIAGTSIGAVVGAFYAVGQLDRLEEYANHVDWRTIISFLDLAFPTQGLLNGDKICHVLEKHLCDQRVEDTPIPFRCIATNLMTRRAVCLDHGLLVDAIRASISIPGIFTPALRKDGCLVDGGIVNPIPIDIVRNMGAEIVIAVDLSHSLSTQESHSNSETSSEQEDKDSQPQEEIGLISTVEATYDNLQGTVEDKLNQWMPTHKSALNIFDIIGNSIDVMEQRLTRNNLEIYPPDILIEVETRKIGLFDFHQATPAIQSGYQQMKQKLVDLKQLLS